MPNTHQELDGLCDEISVRVFESASCGRGIGLSTACCTGSSFAFRVASRVNHNHWRHCSEDNTQLSQKSSCTKSGDDANLQRDSREGPMMRAAFSGTAAGAAGAALLSTAHNIQNRMGRRLWPRERTV